MESEVRSVGIYLNPGNTGFLESIRSEIYVDKTELMEELSEAYGDVLNGREVRLAPALRKIYAKTGKPFIFLIDEWDCVMRERQESEGLQKQYLDFLRNLLKDQPYVALAYMTGILPVKKYGQHSALNMFWEYSMTEQFVFEEYTGFTEDEVKELCVRYDMDFDGLKAAIVEMLGGQRVKVHTWSFQNDMCNFQTKDDVLTLLIHLGYLGYDPETEAAFIPNKEIIGEFENAMSVSGWPEVMRVLKVSEQLLLDTLHGNEEAVARGLDGRTWRLLLYWLTIMRIHLDAPSGLPITAPERNTDSSGNCLPGGDSRMWYSCRCRL